MKIVEIETSSKHYSVFIGTDLRFELGEILAKVLKKTPSTILIITDNNVASLYLEDVKSSLSSFSMVYDFQISAGEASKSFQEYYAIQSFALEKGLDRQSLIIALGGGVVGDLAGFVASTYMRGISFVQVPTTLLAHDSSVGGKVAINHPLGKNMVGSFYQPEAVIYDTATLLSLPEKEWRSGYAEVIKHAFIWSEEFYLWLQGNVKHFSHIKGPIAEQLLESSISIKAAVVKEDEKEEGIRAFLNFGHTLAHAVEAVLGYGKITHGEAVIVGMIFAMRVSEHYYGINLRVESLKKWLKTLGYQVSIPSDLSVSELMTVMKKDKKAVDGIVNMVLIKELGKVEVISVPEQTLTTLLQKELAEGSNG